MNNLDTLSRCATAPVLRNPQLTAINGSRTAPMRDLLITLGAFLVLRVGQLLFVVPEDGDAFEQVLFSCSGYAQVAFFFVPLYSVLMLLFADDQFKEVAIVRYRSRLHVAFALFQGVVVRALLFALACWASGIATAGILLGSVALSMPWALGTLALEWLFFTACGLVFCSLRMASGSAVVGCMGAVVYGLWDFMASNVVGGGVPYVGWGCTFPPQALASAGSAMAYAGPLLASSFLFLGILVAVVQRVDLACLKGGRR